MTAMDTALIKDLVAKPLPLLKEHRQLCLDLLNNEKKSTSEINAIVTKDAALTLTLLSRVNKTGKGKQKRQVPSVESAVYLLGNSALLNVIEDTPALDETTWDTNVIADYTRILERYRHVAFQVESWRKMAGKTLAEEGVEAPLCAAAAELSLCLHRPKEFQKLETEFSKGKKSWDACSEEIFSVDAKIICYALAEHYQLPDDILDCFNEKYQHLPRVKRIQLASELSRCADFDWYSEHANICKQDLAGFLGVEYAAACRLAHQGAISAARVGRIGKSQVAASRIVQLPPNKPSQKPLSPAQQKLGASVSENSAAQTALLHAHQEFAMRKDLQANDVVRILLQVLNKSLQMQRVGFSKFDKQSAQFVATLGLAQDSKLRSLKMTIGRGQLFAQLRSKQQAIWVNDDNFVRYSTIIPGVFKQASASQNYCCMSIFYGGRALGFVFADRGGVVFDEETYLSFKKICGMASQALGRISTQAKQKKAANA